MKWTFAWTIVYGRSADKPAVRSLAPKWRLRPFADLWRRYLCYLFCALKGTSDYGAAFLTFWALICTSKQSYNCRLTG